MFVNELVGALVQLVLFAAVPFIVWLIFARKKCNFFEWIGLKSPKHEGNLLVTILVTVLSVAFYIALTSYITKKYSEGLTTAGSDFAGKGFAAFPAVLAYGFIRTGLSEELLFRGFFLKRIGSKFGFAVGNTVQALLFGLLHGVPFGIATHSVVITVIMTLLPGALGWFQGWLNEKRFNGSIIPSWFIHSILNAIVASSTL